MALAPLLNTGYVIVDLQAPLPREEVSPHQEIVESGDTHELEELSDRLYDDAILEIEGLHCLVGIVQKAQEVVHAVCGVVVGRKKLS